MEFTLRRSYKFLNILFIASMLVPCQSFGMGKLFGLGNSNGGGLAPDMVREIGQALMEGIQSGLMGIQDTFCIIRMTHIFLIM